MVFDAMKIVVVGGMGFIGFHVVSSLLSKGHSVLVFDRNISEDKFANFVGSNLSFFAGDLNDEKCLEVINDEVDIVINLASSSTPKSSNEDMVGDVQTNLIGSLRLIKKCVDVGVRRFVFASSGGTVYGNPIYIPVDENHPNKPICSYGIVKLAVEKYLALFHELHGLSYCSLRFSNPYGPGQNPSSGQGVVAAFVNKILKGEPIQVWGDGTVIRDFIYIDDLVESIERSVFSENSGVYNLGSGVGYSINQIIDCIAECLDCNPHVDYLPARSVDVKEIVLDISKGVRDFGYKINFSMAEGVKRMCIFFNS